MLVNRTDTHEKVNHSFKAYDWLLIADVTFMCTRSINSDQAWVDRESWWSASWYQHSRIGLVWFSQLKTNPVTCFFCQHHGTGTRSHGGHSFPWIFSQCNSPYASPGEDTCASSWEIPHKCLERCYWPYSFLWQVQNSLNLILPPNPLSSVLGEEKHWFVFERKLQHHSAVKNQNQSSERFTDLSGVAWRSGAAVTGVSRINSREERWFIQSTHWLAATQRTSVVSHWCGQYLFRSQSIPGWMLPPNNIYSEMHHTNIHMSGNEWKASYKSFRMKGLEHFRRISLFFNDIWA